MEVETRKLFDRYILKRTKKDWIKNIKHWDRLMILKEFLSEGTRVSDVGCGEIEPLIVANHRNTTALDISRIGLQNLKKKGFQGHLILASCTHLPFHSFSFDRAVCSEVIEHLPKEESIYKTVRELSRVSRKFLVTTPNNEFGFRWFDQTHKHFLNVKSIVKFLPKTCKVETSNICTTLVPYSLLRSRFFLWLEHRLWGLHYGRTSKLNLWLFGKAINKLKRRFIGGAFVVATCW